jgi:hypothetical protein
MPDSLKALNEQADRAVRLQQQRRSRLAVSNAIELSLTDTPLDEVLLLLATHIQHLQEFSDMELDYKFAGLEGAWPVNHRQWVEKRRVGRERFLTENDLTEFQAEVIGELLDPENGHEERLELFARLLAHADLLDSSGWTPMRSTGDMVVRPAHYDRFPLEPTKFAMEYGLNWCEGNALKYLSRFPFKNGTEDLRKASRYIEMEDRFMAGREDWSE